MKKHAARALIVAIEHYPSFKNEMADLPGLAEQGQKLADWVKSAFLTAEISLQLGVKGDCPQRSSASMRCSSSGSSPRWSVDRAILFSSSDTVCASMVRVDLLVLGDFSSVMDSPQSLLPIDELTPSIALCAVNNSSSRTAAGTTCR